MTKEQLFLNTLRFIQDKYKISFIIKKDNRINRMGCFSYKKKYYIFYTTKQLFKRYNIIYSAYHECGHIFNKLPYNNFKQEVYSEFMAERWALNKIKKDYLKIYNWRVKDGKKDFAIYKTDPKKYEPYLSAWKMIKEYN